MPGSQGARYHHFQLMGGKLSARTADDWSHALSSPVACKTLCLLAADHLALPSVSTFTPNFPQIIKIMIWRNIFEARRSEATPDTALHLPSEHFPETLVGFPESPLMESSHRGWGGGEQQTHSVWFFGSDLLRMLFSIKRTRRYLNQSKSKNPGTETSDL